MSIINKNGILFSANYNENIDKARFYKKVNRNLLEDSWLINLNYPKNAIREGCNNVTSVTPTNDGLHLITPSDGSQNNGIMFRFNDANILLGITYDDTITFSVDLKGTTDSHSPKIQIVTNYTSTSGWWYSNGNSNTATNITDLSSEWKRYSVTKKLPSKSGTLFILGLGIHGNYQSDIYIRNLKLELGDIATPWTASFLTEGILTMSNNFYEI